MKYALLFPYPIQKNFSLTSKKKKKRTGRWIRWKYLPRENEDLSLNLSPSDSNQGQVDAGE